MATLKPKQYSDIEPGESDDSGWLVLEEEGMIAFAQEWDPMPFHVDANAAAKTVFGAITASSLYSWGLKQ